MRVSEAGVITYGSVQLKTCRHFSHILLKLLAHLRFRRCCEECSFLGHGHVVTIWWRQQGPPERCKFIPDYTESDTSGKYYSQRLLNNLDSASTVGQWRMDRHVLHIRKFGLYQKYNLELSSHLDLSSTGCLPRFETMQCLHLDGRHTHYFGCVCRKNTLNSKKKTRWPNFSVRRTACLRCPIVSQSGFGISCTYSFPLSSTLYSLLASLPHSRLVFTVTPAEWPVRSSSGSSTPDYDRDAWRCVQSNLQSS